MKLDFMIVNGLILLQEQSTRAYSGYPNGSIWTGYSNGMKWYRNWYRRTHNSWEMMK